MAGALNSKPLSENFSLTADTIVLALGGASRPETGSDGRWPALLAAHGVEIAPWVPANCGWEVDWPPELLARAEGMPLKNLAVRAGDESVSGELLITRHGLEGGAIYRLGRALRSMKQPRLEIDLKPQLTIEAMRERAAALAGASDWFRAWKLSAGHDCVARDHLSGRLPRTRTADCSREEFHSAPARPAAHRRGNFLGWRSALERTRPGPYVAQNARRLRCGRDDRLGSAYGRLSSAGLFCHRDTRGQSRRSRPRWIERS